MGVAGCSSITGSESPSLQILIFNASQEVEPLEYSITEDDSTVASGSIQVAPTADGNHYTIQSYEPSLQRGDELRIEVRLPDRDQRAIADLALQCSKDCMNSFTIRISEGSRVSVRGIN